MKVGGSRSLVAMVNCGKTAEYLHVPSLSSSHRILCILFLHTLLLLLSTLCIPPRRILHLRNLRRIFLRCHSPIQNSGVQDLRGRKTYGPVDLNIGAWLG